MESSTPAQAVAESSEHSETAISDSRNNSPTGAAPVKCTQPTLKGGGEQVAVRLEEKIPSVGCWMPEISPVDSGTRVRFLPSYKNLGNAVQENVVARVGVPPNATMVPNSTYLSNATNPDGVQYGSNNVENGGIVIGDYA
jgi:hypothetical protein